MRRYAIIALLFAAPATAGESHCSNNERVIFSCPIAKSNKVVSLCASPDLSKTKGHLAYRFGAVGNVELEHPSTPAGSAKKFRHAHYSRYQTDRFEVSFSIGQFTYSVFDYYEESEKVKERRGVHVSPGEGAAATEITLSCVGPVTARLHKLEDIVPCDAENALARCQ